ncbi:MAG: helicase-related protein, partial [Bacillota bacterium]
MITRDQVVNLIRKEFIGPNPVNKDGYIQSNGEEICTKDEPLTRYSAGILFPQRTLQDSNQLSEYAEEIPLLDEDEMVPNEIGIKKFSPKEEDEPVEDVINQANSYNQSVMGLTCSTYGKLINVTIKAGTYYKVEKEINGYKVHDYYRKPLTYEHIFTDKELPINTKKITRHPVYIDEQLTDLQISIIFRDTVDGKPIYTFVLENTAMSANERAKSEECFFQVEMVVTSEVGFLPLKIQNNTIMDEDEESNSLLYREIGNYAIGHGCSTTWDDQSNTISYIRTEIFPEYEIKPVIPMNFPDLNLSMIHMMNSKNNYVNDLKLLCNKYELWINDIEIKSSQLNHQYNNTANRHIKNGRECLQRMREGIHFLESNKEVSIAFELMNEAMLMQQLHYNMPLKKWQFDKKGNKTLLNQQVIPEIDDPNTWSENHQKLGKWRPFQIAFILMNLKSMYDKNSDDRKKIDLIWFPTGGGKTEAYLGLSAFTIFIRRLLNAADEGTAILMRYTLRVLTAQQYNRASSLICACEILRSRNPQQLGEKRISIGLWVGDSTTPNKRKKSVTVLTELQNHRSSENPFIIMKCPWCGAQMGVIDGNVVGYERNTKGADKVLFKCENSIEKCHFAMDDVYLPLQVVDDEIYEEVPTMILGTVDKFAILPFSPKTQVIFGYRNGKRFSAPDLIIQDELHLISGPLGSMVGHYETLIHELCSYNESGTKITPKIIASTATISRAKEQCNALYACGKENVVQFPPSGLDYGNSFFASVDQNKIGRKYVGIFAPAASSYATATIRALATNLFAGAEITASDDERDPYWTDVVYFNSIRELGQAATWIQADITEYLHVKYLRDLAIPNPHRRYIYESEELTSRINSSKIPEIMQNLETKYPAIKPRPIDIVLATNMISVGVDVPRLGLMTVIGQPKTTSEYIQATSRVGRSEPGLVFTLYNPSRPRDRSHYEQFTYYHATIYNRVEPTSVTPFSAPLRDRSLHAIIIGLLRQRGTDVYNDSVPRIPNVTEMNEIIDVIKERVQKVDKQEVTDTIQAVRDFFAEWNAINP